jgi:ABC-2 type transport system permease protein
MTESDQLTLVITPHRSVPARLHAVWRYRELLAGLIRKELKVKYKGSSLGFFWSMLNPAMYLLVFYVVFQVILGSGIPYFTVYLLSGLLAWNLFNASLMGATGSVVGNGALVNKVYFPREILPLAAVGANVVHFCLQLMVLLAALAIFRYDVDFGYLWLAPLAIVVLLVVAAGLAILLAALNVYFRDLQHLMELAMLAWFWMTPIVYPWQLPADQLASRGIPTLVTLLNPVTAIVITLQRGIYGTASYTAEDGTVVSILPHESSLWYLRNLAIVGVGATILLGVAIHVFGRLESNFAEEL